jgi:hypothetical protein
MRSAILVLTVAAAIYAPAAANAITIRPTKQTCPVGGEVFDFMQVGSYSAFGARPDGRAYGVLTGLPMPECPGNHLVMFRPFKPEEIGRLASLIESPTYRGLVVDGTPTSRAAWLAQALGDPPREVAVRALVASWDADGQPETKRRLQRDFIAAMEGLGPLSDDMNSWWLRARRANAHRELGEFAIALTQAEAETQALAANATMAPDDRGDLAAYLAEIAIVVRRHDASAEPLDMVPDSIRHERCAALASKRGAAQPPGICSRP